MDDAPTIALIGFGAFGRLAARRLSPHAAVLVHDPRADDAEVRSAGAHPATFDQAAGAPVVVLAVPVQAIEPVLDRLAPRLTPGALVADVASVKMLPVRWMLQRLPAHASILGTHPLFGPQTDAELGGVAGEPIALCPVRIDDHALARVRAFLTERVRLRVLDLTPDEHDRQMALVQVVTHLIGHAAREMRLPELDTATVAYRRLLQMMHNVERDSDELFDAIQRLNPHAGATRDRFLAAMETVRRRAEQRAPEA